MAEVLVTFNDAVVAPSGTTFRARACGREMDDGRWEGWVEFETLDGSCVLRSGRETTQPNRTDTEYWATGLTPVYLEGALERALHPVRGGAPLAEAAPAFEGPRPVNEDAVFRAESVLNPFSVYRKGEALLRRQLSAFATWHLVNIIKAYNLSDQPTEDLQLLPSANLVELIVSEVRERSARLSA